MNDRRNQRGVALIITLAMIAMLTFLIVAFFSRAVTNLQVESTSTGNARADILAKSASEIVVGDFKAEIVAGSIASGPPQASSYVYRPSKPANAVPSLCRYAFSIYDAPTFVNLVKQSTGRFFPADATRFNTSVNPVIQNVTEVTTEVISPNGRSVINKRWDEPTNLVAPMGPQLLVSTTTPTYCRFYDNKMLPHWIMMSRQGVPASQTFTSDWKNYSLDNPKAAIGRFAYNVYDTSGLLDVNVAGYPEQNPTTTGTPTLPPTALGQKGSLGLAQLSVIPGIDSAANAATFTGVWRNMASGTTANDYLAYLGFSKNGATNLFPTTTPAPFFAAGTKSGFLQPAVGTNAADRRILGRQDLIRLASKSAPVAPPATPAKSYGLSVSSLPYLTHFSRETNAPSWSPLLDASDPSLGGSTNSAYAYKTNADSTTAPNRFFPGVQVPANATWTRLTGEKVVPGEPLVKYRFPLSWLALLQDADPATPVWEVSPEATAIVAAFDLRRQANGGQPLAGASPTEKAKTMINLAFGLDWDTANFRWTYINPSKIALLSEITGREPNFFELLKAGMLSGSLGDASDFESFCAGVGNDAKPDYQVMQVGANIIDQADPDSYPTQIAFGNEMGPPNNLVIAMTTANPATTGSVKVFYGVEDIPYLQSVLATPYRLPAGEPNLGSPPLTIDAKQTATRDYLNGWLQFVLWKPQQQAAAFTKAPTQFRVALTPGADGLGIKLLVEASHAAGANFAYIDNVAVSTAPVLQAATITFADSPTSFRAPAVLGGMGTSSTDSFNCSQPQGNGSNPQAGGSAQLPRGMWLGETLRPEEDYIYGSPNRYDAPPTKPVELRCSSLSHLELQYQDGAGGWHGYQIFDHFGMGTGSGFGGRGLYGFSDSPTGQGNAHLPLNSPNFPAYKDIDVAQLAVSAADPRSRRFGLMAMFLDPGPGNVQSPNFIGDWRSYLKQGWWPSGTGNSYNASFNPANNTRFSPSWTGGGQSNPWYNHSTYNPILNPTNYFADNLSSGNYYKDMDGVARRGDGDFSNTVRPMQLSSATVPNTPTLGLVMNRPFHSVGELGYVFRDQPWKSVDLFSANSADAALLDIFSVNEQPAVVAGKVNLNTRNAPALQAVIAGGSREELNPANVIDPAAALNIATALVGNTSDLSGTANTGPLSSPGEIANRLATILPATNNPDQAIKTRREVVARALAGSGQTRTWNFLVDIVAQSGRFTPNATAAAQFVVEGEKRYWLHVAIDRATGQVIDQQLEPIAE